MKSKLRYEQIEMTDNAQYDSTNDRENESATETAKSSQRQTPKIFEMTRKFV